MSRYILNRLNQAKMRIARVMKSATLIFNRVGKSSQHTVNLSQQEIRGNVSMSFSFDGSSDLSSQQPFSGAIPQEGMRRVGFHITRFLHSQNDSNHFSDLHSDINDTSDIQ
jgi:hypothetical protein